MADKQYRKGRIFIPLVSKWYFLSPGQFKVLNGVEIKNTTDQMLRVQLTVAEHYKEEQ